MSCVGCGTMEQRVRPLSLSVVHWLLWRYGVPRAVLSLCPPLPLVLLFFFVFLFRLVTSIASMVICTIG